MLNFIKGNKKLSASILGILTVVLVAVLGKLKIVVSETAVENVLQTIWLYVAAQGVADFGKHAKAKSLPAKQ